MDKIIRDIGVRTDSEGVTDVDNEGGDVGIGQTILLLAWLDIKNKVYRITNVSGLNEVVTEMADNLWDKA